MPRRPIVRWGACNPGLLAVRAEAGTHAECV